jgi:hypothetical protein
MLQTRLELNRADRRCAADVETLTVPVRMPEDVTIGSNLLGDVVHVAVPFCHQGNLVLIAHNFAPCRSGISLLV